MKSAGAIDPGCPEQDLEPRIHIVEDFSREKFSVQWSQPMYPLVWGKECYALQIKSWLNICRQ